MVNEPSVFGLLRFDCNDRMANNADPDQTAPLRSRFFPFRVDPFSGGSWCAGNETGSPEAEPFFYPRAIIRTILVEVHKITLPTKYEWPGPSSFRQADFKLFPVGVYVKKN